MTLFFCHQALLALPLLLLLSIPRCATQVSGIRGDGKQHMFANVAWLTGWVRRSCSEPSFLGVRPQG